MTAKEKAEDLIDKYRPYARFADSPITAAKACAIIAANEVMRNLSLEDYQGLSEDQWHFYLKYWIEVRAEISKL